MILRRSNWTVLGAVLLAIACGGGDAPATDEVADTAEVPEAKPDLPAERGYPTERTGGVAGVLGEQGDSEAVAVTITDGGLQLSRDSIGGGPVTVVIENKGTQRHVVEVFSEHYGRWRSAPIPPGGSASISMPLTYATYEVFCTVTDETGEHKAKGEVATLRVQ